MFRFTPAISSLGKELGQVLEQLDVGQSYCLSFFLGVLSKDGKIGIWTDLEVSKRNTQNAATQKYRSYRYDNFLRQDLLYLRQASNFQM